ncbi:hypothetical protein DFH06DRAFT_1135283 [Mycena polygramma]|nr:hypothetical protein DFH06DRAFT_1135283 [Mycena polygramma]
MRLPGGWAISASLGDKQRFPTALYGLPSPSPPRSRPKLTIYPVLRLNSSEQLMHYWIYPGWTFRTRLILPCCVWCSLIAVDGVACASMLTPTTEIIGLIVNGHLGRLEELQVINSRCTMRVIPDVFSNAPNLHRVVLADEDFFYSLASDVIPWVQITHYQGTYTVERQLQILRDAPNLLECSIGLKDFDDSGPDANRILSHLRRLCIEEAAFLRHLTMPLLEALTVICRTVGRKHDKEAQITLFSEMSFPSVLPLCPTFAFGYLVSTPWDAFFTMPQTRFQQIPTLSLRIFDAGDLTSDPPESLVTRVKALQDDGMDIKLLDGHDSKRLMSSFCGDDVFSVLLEL